MPVLLFAGGCTQHLHVQPIEVAPVHVETKVKVVPTTGPADWLGEQVFGRMAEVFVVVGMAGEFSLERGRLPADAGEVIEYARAKGNATEGVREARFWPEKDGSSGFYVRIQNSGGDVSCHGTFAVRRDGASPATMIITDRPRSVEPTGGTLPQAEGE